MMSPFLNMKIWNHNFAPIVKNTTISTAHTTIWKSSTNERFCFHNFVNLKLVLWFLTHYKGSENFRDMQVFRFFFSPFLLFRIRINKTNSTGAAARCGAWLADHREGRAKPREPRAPEREAGSRATFQRQNHLRRFPNTMPNKTRPMNQISTFIVQRYKKKPRNRRFSDKKSLFFDSECKKFA